MKTRFRSVLLSARGVVAKVWLSPVRWLIAAAIFHIALTVAMYGVGRYALLPSTFDSYGVAVSAAPDSALQRADAAALSESLRRGEMLNWLKAAEPPHVKLYSICFALFGRWLGFGIISVEPFNVLCYLAILLLVFSIGRETFNRRTGLLAAVAVALWPSFLLHTTQVLKDSLFVVALLAFVLVLVRWLTRTYTWPRALLTGLGGGLLAVVLWFARDNMGEILIPTVLLGAALLIVRQFRERRWQRPSLVGMALMLLLTISATQFIPKFRKQDFEVQAIVASVMRRVFPPPGVKARLPALSIEATSSAPWARLAARVGTVRSRFIASYPESGSNIDGDVELTNTTDLVRYFPRAVAIGFFAPFPDMWFGAGKQVGSTARLLSGVETLAIYAIEALAVFGLWRGRRQLPVWLLFSVATTALVALGFVVVNVGALFRLRYAFIILIIIIGAAGAAHLLERFSGKPAAAQQDAGASG